MSDPILGPFLAALGKREQELALEATENVLPMQRYAEIVGQRQGLKLAKQLLEQLLVKNEEEESQR